jgi:hypothetical protein
VALTPLFSADQTQSGELDPGRATQISFLSSVPSSFQGCFHALLFYSYPFSAFGSSSPTLRFPGRSLPLSINDSTYPAAASRKAPFLYSVNSTLFLFYHAAISIHEHKLIQPGQ